MYIFQEAPRSSQWIYESTASTNNIHITINHSNRVALREGDSFARLKITLSK
jgi:hypothetical protein